MSFSDLGSSQLPDLCTVFENVTEVAGRQVPRFSYSIVQRLLDNLGLGFLQTLKSAACGCALSFLA